jgi:RHS repeat-associated protein
MDSRSAYLYRDGVTPIEQVNLSTGGITYLVADSLGSVRSTVNSSGSLSGATSYDAWGKPQASGGLASATPFGFAGGYTDPTGLIYLVNRYYDPSTGQFLSVDPEVRTTLQPYAYTQGNPVSQTDPAGLVSARGVVNWALANINGSSDGYTDDCTDFASRALNSGGGDPQTWPLPKTAQNAINHRKDDWYWYHGWVGVAKGAEIATSYSWAGAFNLADHENRHGAWFTRHRQQASPGDVISANLVGASWTGIDHTGVITGMKNGMPIITQHSRNVTEPLTVWIQRFPNTHYWIWRPVNG